MSNSGTSVRLHPDCIDDPKSLDGAPKGLLERCRIHYRLRVPRGSVLLPTVAHDRNGKGTKVKRDGASFGEKQRLRRAGRVYACLDIGGP